MNKKILSVVLVLAIASMSCQMLVPDSKPKDLVGGDVTRVSNNLPVYDPAAPPTEAPPSPGAAALQELVKLDPNVAELVSSVEAAESAGLAALIAQMKEENNISSRFDLPAIANLPSLNSPLPATANLIVQPVSYNPAGAFQRSTDNAHTVSLLITLTSGLSDILNPNMPRGAGVAGSLTETKDGTAATMSLDIGLNEDGSSKFNLGMQTETTKNGLTGKTVFAAGVEGLRCPDANGKVSFTAKVRLGADAGGVAYDQDLTAQVTAEVDDQAQIINSKVDVLQGTRQVKDGRQVYVESGVTWTFKGPKFDDPKESNLHAVRISQQATLSDSRTLSGDGHEAALTVGLSALKMAELNWQTGGCIKIEAPEPGKVQPASETAIPVKIMHRLNGGEVSANVKAEVSGGKNISPDTLAKTPGTLTYTAPDEKGQSAVITLTATSKRGKATLKLFANTGGNAYHISGTIDEASMDGVTCDASQPFTIGGTLQFSFTPASPTAGTYTYTGPYEANGKGPYVINGDGTMLIEGTGCILSYCATYSHIWTAAPLDSCP